MYSDGIAELISSAANPERVRLMTLMLRGNGAFSTLMQETGLSKTALANHLSRLAATGLVRRRSRGVYELTTDGRELLGAAISTYRNSACRAEQERNRLQARYRSGFMDANRTGRKTISRPAVYQSCWLSYCGAMAGCITALGNECDITDVGGASGYSFILNVSKGQTCPSGPTATHVKTFKEILKATESLGKRIEPYIYQHSYPAKDGTPSPRELELVSRLFERIRKETDADRPVVLWGLGAPEYGIVNGYDGQSYTVSTFRSLSSGGKPEDPIPFHSLNAPGCIDAFYFREGERTSDSRDSVEEALSRALKFAEARMPVHKGYIAGLEAYDEWADVLVDLPEERQNYLGNSYIGACVAEARAMSAAYLSRISSGVPSGRRDLLAQSSEAYARAAKEMDEFSKLFPFRFEGDMPEKDRRKGADILKKARAHEEEAIGRLKKAVG